jgi:acetyl-CoA carboxylase biotin carboxyl carrier protein
MNFKDIQRLLDAVAAAEISEFSLETADYKLMVKRTGVQAIAQNLVMPTASQVVPTPTPTPMIQTAAKDEAAAPVLPAVTATNLIEITAPIVGTFYASPAPEAPAYVKVGDKVEAGQVLCIIEAMKLMNEIEAEASGKLVEILVKNEDPVEYGQVLFRIEPA